MKVVRFVGSAIKWFVITIVAIVAIVIVVAAVGLGKAGSDSQKASKNVSAHISEIHLGMTKDEVVGILGTPEDSQHFESAFAGTTSTNDCIYYGSLSETSYQFCFDNGSLTSKNTY